jgi:transposase
MEAGCACSTHHRATTMEHYAGIDVSLESASLGVVDGTGRIGLEPGPLSPWRYAGMGCGIGDGKTRDSARPQRIQGHFDQDQPQRCARHCTADAARLVPPVRCQALRPRKVRALLAARKLLQAKNHDVEMSLREVLRGFALKVGPTPPRNFPGRIRELVAGHGTLSTMAGALLAARGTLFEEWQKAREAPSIVGARGSPGAAVDDRARRRHDYRAHLHCSH